MRKYCLSYFSSYTYGFCQLIQRHHHRVNIVTSNGLSPLGIVIKRYACHALAPRFRLLDARCLRAAQYWRATMSPNESFRKSKLNTFYDASRAAPFKFLTAKLLRRCAYAAGSRITLPLVGLTAEVMFGEIAISMQKPVSCSCPSSSRY